MKEGFRILLAVFFAVAGANHFRSPDVYLEIMPPWLPFPRALVYLSGGLEIAGGVGALWPATRAAAGVLLIALLVAVLPANVHMAVHDVQPTAWDIPRWVLWARLPFQVVIMGWTWWTCLR